MSDVEGPAPWSWRCRRGHDRQVIRIRVFVGYTLTASLAGFTMMTYFANSSYVLQEQKGLRPMPFALFFAATALFQVLLSVLNAKIVGGTGRGR